MAAREVCGNEYEGSSAMITTDRRAHIFDSIDDAAHAIAPVCAHCGCRVLGHGMQSGGKIYCRASCARRTGSDAVRDSA